MPISLYAIGTEKEKIFVIEIKYDITKYIIHHTLYIVDCETCDKLTSD